MNEVGSRFCDNIQNDYHNPTVHASRVNCFKGKNFIVGHAAIGNRMLLHAWYIPVCTIIAVVHMHYYKLRALLCYCGRWNATSIISFSN